MRKSMVLALALSVLALAGCAGGGGGRRVSTDDGLTLDFAADGRLAGLTLDGRHQEWQEGGFLLNYRDHRKEMGRRLMEERGHMMMEEGGPMMERESRREIIIEK